MFGKNEIVGRKYFQDETKLYITSIFVTLQGEGPFSGLPAVFVRFAKCNLACSFCDTWFDSGTWMSIEQVRGKINSAIHDHWAKQGREIPMFASGFSLPRQMVLVITGGEPTLQPLLGQFCTEMLKDFADVQIESNGIQVPKDIPEDVTLVVSPKCSEKDGKPIGYLKPNADMLARADYLKFVLSADPVSPYHLVPEWALQWLDRDDDDSFRFLERQIYVSPMNIYNKEPEKGKLARMSNEERDLDTRSTVDEVISFWEPGLLNMAANQANHEHAGRYALNNGLRLSLQSHLLVSLA